MITRPDKGKATVIMTRESYVGKKLTILNDTSKFQRLGPYQEFDRTLKIEQDLQKYVKKLFDQKRISESVFKAIRPMGSCRPRMYGLPKVHKPFVPLRPILSMTGSPQYDISKWLVELLRPVLDHYSAHCVKDSFTFADKVRSMQSSPGDHLCSFDIVGLFTNVPLKEVIDICAKTLYHEDVLEVPPPTLTEASFRELLEKVTSGVEFSFEGVMYKQIDGVAMGSPLGPILANIFVGYHERRIQPHQWPQVYDRYVDDIFSHFLSKEACNEFFVTLNNLHPALKFTREDEQDDSLPFLDVLVNRMA